MVSSSASSKRARAPSNGSYNISCSVDGCEADLGSCKDYHKRHKVCEVHAKTSRVMVGGQEQRFCQQCSRFHLLVEFDEVKRSCRKRLDGHNRRRRKPQPDAISSNSGILFTSQQGAAFSSYISATKMTTLGSNWAKATKFRGDPLSHCNNPPLYVLERQSLIPTALSHNSKGGKQLPSLQACSNQKTVEASGCSLVHNITTLDSSSSSSSKVPTNGLSQVLPSNCALSLLSMPLSSSRTWMPRADQIPIARPLVGLRPEGIGRYSCLHASNGTSSTRFSFSGSEDEQVATVLVSDESDADLHAGGGVPLGSGTHQVRPWDD